MMQIAADGDSFEVVGAEIEPWMNRKNGDWTALPMELPIAPKTNSQGGSDIERIAEQLAPNVSGVLLIFSSGPSQLPVGAKSTTLRGGDGAIAGLAGPFRRVLALPDYTGERELLLTIYAAPDPIQGATKRALLQDIGPLQGVTQTLNDTLPKAGASTSKQAEPSPWVMWAMIATLTASVASLVVIIVLATKTSHKQKTAQTDKLTESGSSEPGTVEGLFAHQAKKLEIMVDELYESADQIKHLRDSSEADLRSEVLIREKQIARWADSACDLANAMDSLLKSETMEESRMSLERVRVYHQNYLQQAGVDLIRPVSGDTVDPRMHEAVFDTRQIESDDPGIVGEMIQCGVRIGAKVYRRAKVGVR
jgi:molecular chaperone GrpE (heat shock protein)